MNTKLKNQSGFTIIEVLIVLAIAGLIMVIVFLAVPALQRNSRNTQRNNDASRYAAAVNECLNNKNGDETLCDSGGVDATYIDLSTLQQLTASGSVGTEALLLTYGTVCDNAGTTATAGGGNRSFTVTYQVELTGGGTDNRCIES